MDIDPQCFIRRLIELSSAEDVRFILAYPGQGELAADVAQFVEFSPEDIDRLGEDATLPFSELGERDQEFVVDVATVLIGHFLGANYTGIYDAWSLDDLKSLHRLKKTTVETPNATLKKATAFVSDVDKLIVNITSATKQLSESHPRDLQVQDIKMAVKDYLDKLEEQKFISQLQAQFAHTRLNDALKSGGTPPPSPRGGRPVSWLQHNVLIEQLVLLAKRRDRKITRPRAASREPQNAFHVLISQLIDDLDLSVKFKTLAKRAHAKANH